MGAKVALPPLLLIVLAAYSSVTLALGYSIVDRICIPGPPIVKRAPVPAGCELIDCCPGCPASGPLEWRIKVDAKILERAELSFEGMGAAELKRLNITGKARIDGDRIVLRRGTSRIAGVPETVGGKIAVGSLLPIVRKDAAARLRSLPPGSGAPGSGGVRDGITVQQFLGSFPVNNFRWDHIIRLCASPKAKPPTPKPPTLVDTLKIQGLAPGDSAVVMIDSRKNTGSAGCSNDEILQATGSAGDAVLALGNRRLSGACNSEIAIFSENHAMDFKTPVTAWTNNPGDEHTVPLQPIVNVKVSVWIAYTNAADAQEVEQGARDDMLKANTLYRKNKVGVHFDAIFTKVSDLSTTRSVIGSIVDTINGGISSLPECENIEAVRASASQAIPYYTPNTLNVYYVDVGMAGRNCALKKTPDSHDCKCTDVEKGDGNITYIGSQVGPTTLAHEFGHAFGLRPGPCGGHTNREDGSGGYLAGFYGHNIMADGDDRYSFSVGQVFRMNTHKSAPPDTCGGTMLLENNPALRPGRACPPLTPASAICPALKTDWP